MTNQKVKENQRLEVEAEVEDVKDGRVDDRKMRKVVNQTVRPLGPEIMWLPAFLPLTVTTLLAPEFLSLKVFLSD